MADHPVSFTLTADDQASPEIVQLTAEIDRLTAELNAQKPALSAGGKDWLDYTQQISATADAMTNIVSTVEDVLIKTTLIAAGIEVYRKWQSLVTGVKNAYLELKTAMAAGSALIDVGWAEAQLQVARLEVTVGRLGARLLEFGAIGKALSVAGIALGIAQIGLSANESNEKTRLLTEQIGGLTTALQQLDPASKPVLTAKERFEALTKASLALGVSAEELLPQYKAFFDQTASGSLSVQKSADILTDLAKTYVALHASSAETAAAQEQLTAAFAAGFTTVDQLGTVFGSALNPALDAVAQQMGLTREQLRQLIDSGRLGSEDVIPALAAAAHTLTQPLQSAGDAAEFSKRQFEEMGLSFYDLSAKTLPGVDSALQHTTKEIADTADAMVDPIGAAVEQIVNFGARVEDWARRVKLAITEAFTTEDWSAAWKTGLQEAVYGLDYLLVGLKEEITATGQSLGVLAGAAVTATDPMEALSEVWRGMQDRLLTTRDRLNDYVNALEGVDNASARTAEGVNAATEALKRLKEVPLPEKLKEIVDGLDSAKTASQAVQKVWTELGALDLTGNTLKDLLVLIQTIDAVSVATKDATGTQAAFSQQLSQLPTNALTALLAKVQQLAPLLEASGNQGVLMGTALGAVFAKIGLEAATAGGQLTQYGRDGTAALRAIATTATSTGAQIRSALAAILDSAKTKADIDAISAEFKRLGDQGTLSLQLVADGQAMIARRFVEMQTQIPGIRDGLKDLGVESAASLRALADSAQASFAQIKTGGATLDQLRVGFLAWAEAEIKAAVANDTAVPAIVRHQAAALGLAAALDELIQKHHAVDTAMEANIASMERQAQRSRDTVSATKDLVDAQTAGLRAEIALAKAKGETATVQRLTRELALLEADGAVKVAKAKQAEQEMEYALAVAKRNQVAVLVENNGATKEALALADLVMQKELAEATAAGTNTQAQQALADALHRVNAAKAGATEQTQQNTEATQQDTKATDASVDMLKQLNELLSTTRADMDKLSAAARQYFEIQLNLSLASHGMADAWGAAHDAQVAFNAGLSDNDQALAEYQAQVQEAITTVRAMDTALQFAFNGFQIWEESIVRGAALTKEAFYQQKISVVELEDTLSRLGENGTLSMASIQNATLRANQEFTLLDEEDLSGLRGAIADASAKLKEMQDEAQSAKDRIAELNAEIAAEKGDQATADRMKLQIEQNQALADVEEKLAAAQQAHNRDLIALYEQQKQKLQELYGLKERNLENEIKGSHESTKSSNATITDMNQIAAAANNAASAITGIGKVDLSNVQDQLGGLFTTVNALKSIL